MGSNKTEILYFNFLFWKVQKYNSSPRKFLPELDIHAGFSKFYVFFKIVGSISKYPTFNFAFAYICKMEYPRTGNPMGFTPEVEDEVIR